MADRHVDYIEPGHQKKNKGSLTRQYQGLRELSAVDQHLTCNSEWMCWALVSVGCNDLQTL